MSPIHDPTELEGTSAINIYWLLNYHATVYIYETQLTKRWLLAKGTFCSDEDYNTVFEMWAFSIFGWKKPDMLNKNWLFQPIIHFYNKAWLQLLPLCLQLQCNVWQDHYVCITYHACTDVTGWAVGEYICYSDARQWSIMLQKFAS